VSTYRLYGCDAANKIVHGDYIECADEAAARLVAEGRLETYAAVEVWDGKTRLFRLERGVASD
jgi:hypothetical protein